MKFIYSAGDQAWTPACDSPQSPNRMVKGHPSPCFLSTPLESRSRCIRNEAVIGLRDNGFPGPDVGLDGPAAETEKMLLFSSIIGKFSA